MIRVPAANGWLKLTQLIKIYLLGGTSALVSLAQNAKSPPKGGLNHYALVSSTKVVAGAGLNFGRTFFE